MIMLTLQLVILAITFSLPPEILIQMIVAAILPALVGLVTNRFTPSGLKAGLLALLALLTSGLTELGSALATGADYDIGMWLITAVGSLVMAIALHYGLLKPTGASAKLQAIGTRRTVPTTDPQRVADEF